MFLFPTLYLLLIHKTKQNQLILKFPKSLPSLEAKGLGKKIIILPKVPSPGANYWSKQGRY